MQNENLLNIKRTNSKSASYECYSDFVNQVCRFIVRIQYDLYVGTVQL